MSGQNAGAGGASYGSSGAGFGGSASSYESSSSSSGAGYGAGAGGSSYESSSFSGSAGYGADASLVAGGAVGVGGSSFDSSSTQVQRYATNAQGLFNDPNPQIIRRPAVGGVQTYTQHIKVRFLQPPPIPPPGVSNLYHCS